jgi:hypothetical protein
MKALQWGSSLLPSATLGNRLFWLFSFSTFLFIEFGYIVRAVHLLSCAYICFYGTFGVGCVRFNKWICIEPEGQRRGPTRIPSDRRFRVSDVSPPGRDTVDRIAINSDRVLLWD